MKRLTSRQYAQALNDAWQDATPAKQSLVIQRFLQQISRRRQMKLLPRIVEHIQKLNDAAAGRTRVHLWAARPIDLQTLLTKALGPVVLETHIDPSLLGGVKLQIQDQLIDGTLRSRLQRLQTHLSQ